MCVDAKGDIYVANFGAGDAVEYAHGGTTVLNTYSSSGAPVGCSVDAAGDVAVTSFSPAEIIVYAGGDPNKGTTYGDSSCAFNWTAGYDDAGNLYATSENSSQYACELPAGGSGLREVTLSGASGSAGAVMWDGKHLAISLQGGGTGFNQALARVSESPSSGDLTVIGTTGLKDSCYEDYVNVVNPFYLGNKNTPANHAQSKTVLGSNLRCVDEGSSKVNFWKYPQRRRSLVIAGQSACQSLRRGR